MTESEMVKADVLVETEHEVLVAVSFGVPCSKDSRTVQLTTAIKFPENEKPLMLTANITLNQALDLQSALNNAIRSAADVKS